MKFVEFSYHKDGDHLVIVERPWWRNVIDSAACAAVPVLGFLPGGWKLVNAAVTFAARRDREFSIQATPELFAQYAAWDQWGDWEYPFSSPFVRRTPSK